MFQIHDFVPHMDEFFVIEIDKFSLVDDFSDFVLLFRSVIFRYRNLNFKCEQLTSSSRTAKFNQVGSAFARFLFPFCSGCLQPFASGRCYYAAGQRWQ